MSTLIKITFKNDKTMQMVARDVELDNKNNRLICHCDYGKYYYIMLDSITMYQTSPVY